MLPEDWKKEIGNAIEQADARNAERHEAQIASQNAIATPLDRLDHQFRCYRREQRKAEQSKRCRDLATIAGIFLAAFVALVAIWITHLDSSDQITALNGQVSVLKGQLSAMERDEIPYVFVSEPGSPQYAVDKNGIGRIVWQWHFLNFGKGRAVKLLVDHYISLDNGPFKRPDGFKSAAFGGDDPPNKDNWAITNSGPMTREEFSRLLSIEHGISILIEFHYRDIPGKAFETRVCMGRDLSTGAVATLDPEQCEKNKQE